MNAVSTLATRDIRLRVAHGRLAVAVAVLGSLAALLALRLKAPGWPMDEGAILAYGGRILAGDVPARDLHPFYGPLSSYLAAGVFKVLGTSVGAERALGLAYRLVLAGSLLTLVRRRGAGAMLATGLVLVALLPQQGDAAFAVYGALACACLALALADLERPLLAGLAAGASLLMRFDFALPLVLAGMPFLVAWPWRARLRLVGGAAAGALLYAPYLAVVGSAKLQLWVHQLRSGQGGRSLPLPAWTSGTGRLLAVTIFAIAAALAAGWLRRRTTEGVTLVASALFGLGLLPYAFDRADRAHVVIAALVPLAVTPLLGIPRRMVVAAGGTLLAVAVAAAAAGHPGPVLAVDVVSPAFDVPQSYDATYRGRSFPLVQPNVASNASQAAALADRLAPAGGSIFVGPRDLRRTTYSDAYLYFLLPRLRPATFYITLDPGTTDVKGARLADEIGNASVLILDGLYDGNGEANAQAEAFGTAAPNRVVAHRFCARATFGAFTVLQRCS